MCRETNVQWPCGHALRTFRPCENAIPRNGEEGSSEEDAYEAAVVPPNTFTTGNAGFLPCDDLTSRTVPNPAEVPFCMYPSCVPNYWSCCECQAISPFGTQSGRENGKRAVSSTGRLRRLAPTYSATKGAEVLQTGDVCGDRRDEDDENEDGLIPVSNNPSPCWDVLCGCRPEASWPEGDYHNEEEDQGAIPALSLSELHSILAEMADTVHPLPDDIPANAEAGCGHMRCKKCLTWRRCPCGCVCPKLVPATRRSCSVCMQSGCDTVERIGLWAFIEEMILTEWEQQPHA